MITLKKLAWDNLFSYSKNNVIEFDKNPITQLLGKNGHGKSSIALILEEVLYNKNSKGIKKVDILNRYTKDKSYSIELSFNKDGDEYIIKTVRGTTQTVQLFKNTDNISAHTATGTLTILENILGIDHKTFAQLVYQSSASSLEFLTATDTNRKKFLIDLLNLNKYMEAFEVFKALAKELDKEVAQIESSIQTTQAWVNKHSKESLDEIELKDYPVWEDNLAEEKAVLNASLLSITETNKSITKNNQYRKQLESLDLSKILDPVPIVDDSTPLISRLGEYKKSVKDAEAFILKVGKLNGTCPTCLQQVDRIKLDELVFEQQSIINEANLAIEKINKAITDINSLKKKVDIAAQIKSDYESYSALVDNTIQTELLDADNIKSKISLIEAALVKQNKEIAEIEAHNTKATAHNSRIAVIKEQLEENSLAIADNIIRLEEVSEKLSYVQLLQKTFSTSGLIAYKIERMVKDLEDLANEYLAELSSGRFQLTFKVTASDKLNVIITDNGRDIEILALSGGERARVNTATLLAIRKLMQSLSSTRINLLILDETIDSLDIEGKEKLIEVLLGEEHLNTILISHGYTHPLLEKITVIKDNNISRLE